jgi:hypothetical protein
MRHLVQNHVNDVPETSPDDVALAGVPKHAAKS